MIKLFLKFSLENKTTKNIINIEGHDEYNELSFFTPVQCNGGSTVLWQTSGQRYGLTKVNDLKLYTWVIKAFPLVAYNSKYVISKVNKKYIKHLYTH